jgi:hypothetical protein
LDREKEREKREPFELLDPARPEAFSKSNVSNSQLLRLSIDDMCFYLSYEGRKITHSALLLCDGVVRVEGDEIFEALLGLVCVCKVVLERPQ